MNAPSAHWGRLQPPVRGKYSLHPFPGGCCPGLRRGVDNANSKYESPEEAGNGCTRKHVSRVYNRLESDGGGWGEGGGRLAREGLGVGEEWPEVVRVSWHRWEKMGWESCDDTFRSLTLWGRCTPFFFASEGEGGWETVEGLSEVDSPEL